MKKMISNHKKLVLTLLGLVIAIILPLIFKSHFQRHILILILIWSILGMGWNFIGGYAGQVSNGHSFFYAIGAYSCAIGLHFFGITPWICMWVGVLIAAVVSAIIGAPLLRLKGHYFAVATMAVGECARFIFQNWSAIGGATGIDFLNPKADPLYAMQFKNKIIYYYIILVFVGGILLLTSILSKSKFGYYLRTIKGNEVAAESVGINTARYKMYAYVLSAMVVSLGGSLYAQYMLYIDPPMLMTLNISIMMVLVPVMGGVGTVMGPIIGAIVLTMLSENTRAMFGGNGADMLLYGLLVIFFVLFLPDGIISFVPRLRKMVSDRKQSAEKA